MRVTISLWTALLVLGFLSLGCSGTPPQASPVTPAGQGVPAPTQLPPEASATVPSITTVPTRPTSTPLSTPTAPTPILAPRSSNPADVAVQAARAELARGINMPADRIQVVAVEEVNWPDASLGCPQPGMAYIQVITPGFKVTLTASGQQYEVHTDLRGRAVMCSMGKMK